MKTLLNFIRFKWTNNQLYLSIKQANSIPTLPRIVENYINHPYIILWRFGGAICAYLTLSKCYNIFPNLFHYLIILWATLYITHTLIIISIKWIYLIYLKIKRPEVFIFRTSALEQLNTNYTPSWFYINKTFLLAASITTFLIATVIYDTFLEYKGIEPFFMLITIHLPHCSTSYSFPNLFEVFLMQLQKIKEGCLIPIKIHDTWTQLVWLKKWVTSLTEENKFLSNTFYKLIKAIENRYYK